MQQRTLGSEGLAVAELGLGCMGMASSPTARSGAAS